MRHMLVIVSILMAFGIVRADETSHRRLAEEFLTMMNGQKNVEQLMEIVKQAQLAKFASMQVPSWASEKLKQFANNMTELMAREMSWENLKSDYIAIYTQTFSEKEIQDAITFYKSPSGKAQIEKMPEIIKQSSGMIQRISASVAPKIDALLKQLAQELEEESKQRTQKPE